MAKTRINRSINPNITLVDNDLEITEALTLPLADPVIGVTYADGTIRNFANGDTYKMVAGSWVQIGKPDVFATNTTVSLSGGKRWLGVYPTGTTVATIGKTMIQVALEAASEAIAPTLTLTSPTAIQFNQTAISNVLNFTKTINTAGATVATALLEWRRNNSGSWVTLSSSTSATTFTHSLTDTGFNAQPFNYRYTVTDTGGGTNQVTKDVIPTAYAQPNVSPLTQAAVSLTAIESNSVREKGNINTNISGTITRVSPLVDLVSYQIQYSINGGSYVNLGSPVSISGGSATISSTNHNDTSLNASDTISYRVVVTDTWVPSNSSAITINFYYRIVFGVASSDPTDRTSAIAIGVTPNANILSNASNVVNLHTGTTVLNQYVLLPTGRSISSAYDTTALGVPVTYTNTGSFPFTDPTGATVSGYTLWKRTQGTLNGTDHIHLITT
jgi:hypothetical protein